MQRGFASDGGPGDLGAASTPRGLVFDLQGNLDIAEVFLRVHPPCLARWNYFHRLHLAAVDPTRSLFMKLKVSTIDGQDNLYFTEWMGGDGGSR